MYFGYNMTWNLYGMHPIVCHTNDIYNGKVYTAMILKKIKYTLPCQHLFLLVVDGDATCFDPLLGSSSGIQEY
jgi:hypothetical protein